MISLSYMICLPLEALVSLMFLLEKIYVRVKARDLVDGKKQCAKYIKYDEESQTELLEGNLISSAIEAHKNRDVTTIDIPGVYLQNDTNDHAIRLLKKTLT